MAPKRFGLKEVGLGIGGQDSRTGVGPEIRVTAGIAELAGSQTQSGFETSHSASVLECLSWGVRANAWGRKRIGLDLANRGRRLRISCVTSELPTFV